MAGMTGNGWKLLEMTGNCCNALKLLEMTGRAGNGRNGWKWIEMAEIGWKQLLLDGMAGNGWILLEFV